MRTSTAGARFNVGGLEKKGKDTESKGKDVSISSESSSGGSSGGSSGSSSPSSSVEASSSALVKLDVGPVLADAGSQAYDNAVNAWRYFFYEFILSGYKFMNRL